eukprot:jgi/Ulvmu1/11474/UM077_0018.1
MNAACARFISFVSRDDGVAINVAVYLVLFRPPCCRVRQQYVDLIMSWASWLTGSGGTTTASSLQTSGDLPRDAFMEFAKKSIVAMSSAEFNSELTDAVKNRGENPDDLIEKTQFQLFESLGIQGHFGMSQLKHIQRRFGKDADVMQLFMELVSAEEAVLDQAELSPESLAAKQAVMKQMQQFQVSMAKMAETVPTEKQAELMQAVSESMKAAATMVPRPEGASPDEAIAAAQEQIRIACEELKRRGFPVPDGAARPEGATPSGGAVASSAMTASEQERFLSTMASAPPEAGVPRGKPPSSCACCHSR